jgi:hypothetical protein
MNKITLEVTDSAGELHEFNQDGVRFWHDDDVCRIYTQGVDHKSSETLASFTRPISVVVKKGGAA